MQEQDHHCFGDRFTLLAAPPKVQEEMWETVQCTVECPTQDQVRLVLLSSIIAHRRRRPQIILPIWRHIHLMLIPQASPRFVHISDTSRIIP